MGYIIGGILGLWGILLGAFWGYGVYYWGHLGVMGYIIGGILGLWGILLGHFGGIAFIIGGISGV